MATRQFLKDHYYTVYSALLKIKLTEYYRWFLAVFIAAYGILIYSNTLYSSFHFDDDHYIVDNGLIKNLSHLKPLFFFWPTRFVAFFSFALNYHVNQLDVFGYHVVNICIHIAVSLLVWWFLVLLSQIPLLKNKSQGSAWQGAAFFSALIFLAHPLQTESVTYIYQRSASLAAFFYLLTLCLYLKARLSLGRVSRRRLLFSLAWVCALLGMFTKENIFTLPFMIVLCEFYFFKTGRRPVWKHCLAFLPLLLIALFLLVAVKPVTFGDIRRIIDVPAASSLYGLTQLRVIVTYLRLLVVPLHQNLDYDYPVVENLFDLPVVFSIILISLLIILSARLFNGIGKHKILSYTVGHRLLSFAIVWFFVTLLPESSFVPLNDLIFEHRLYLPMVGFACFLSFGAISFFSPKMFKMAFLILSILAVCYGILTFQRNKVWHDDLSLWNDVVKKSPHKPGPSVNRAIILNNMGLYDAALSDVNRVLHERPDFIEAYNVRGGIFCNQRRYDEALRDLDRAFFLDPNNVEVLFNRGVVLSNKKDFEQASLNFVEAIKKGPYYVKAYVNLAHLHALLGRDIKAIDLFSRALEIDPFNSEACNELAALYGRRRQHVLALGYARRAIALNPHSAQAFLTAGIACGALGDADQAVGYLQKAVELKPDLFIGFYNLAVVYYFSGDRGKAVVYYDKAYEFNQDVDSGFSKLIDACRR